MTTKRQVYDFLRRLGKTPNQIRRTLVRRGIKGQVADCNLCPVATALANRFNDSVYVTRNWTCVGAEDPGSQGEVIRETPKSIVRFIDRFDARKYPELVRE